MYHALHSALIARGAVKRNVTNQFGQRGVGRIRF